MVRANFFPITLTHKAFFEYNVKITPEPRSQARRVKKRILELFENSSIGAPYKDGIVHDGSQRLLAAKRLPQPLTAKIRYFEDGDQGPHPRADEYEIDVEFGKELSTEPMHQWVSILVFCCFRH